MSLSTALRVSSRTIQRAAIQNTLSPPGKACRICASLDPCDLCSSYGTGNVTAIMTQPKPSSVPVFFSKPVAAEGIVLEKLGSKPPCPICSSELNSCTTCVEGLGGVAEVHYLGGWEHLLGDKSGR